MSLIVCCARVNNYYSQPSVVAQSKELYGVWYGMLWEELHSLVVMMHTRKGVYKQWNGLLEWWNTGMDFFKVQYHFLNPNK